MTNPLPLPLALYRKTVLSCGTPILRALLSLRLRKGKEDAARVGEKTGVATLPRPEGRLIWIHAASVGEAQSALILIEAMVQAGCRDQILVTTGTVSSATLMGQRLPPFARHQYAPLDHPLWIDRFLDHWRPDLTIRIESELWPNSLLALKERNIPAILVNGRLSEKSFRRWSMIEGASRQMLSTFSLILAQTEKDAGYFGNLGAENVITCDNIKYSAAPLPHDPVSLSALRLAVSGRKAWVYASTHQGEEKLACRVHKALKETLPSILTIIVPRHPERRDDVAEACFEEGLKYTLRGANVALPAPDDDIYIADTLGELGLFYTLCDIAMIGRSFSDDGGGGHNPIEAAQLGCAVMTGPHNQFQQSLYDDMRNGDAVIEVQNESEFQEMLLKLLTDPDLLKDFQNRTQQYAMRKRNVIDHVMQLLTPMLFKNGDERHAA